MPLITIIVPCYNCHQYIDRCIRSLGNQTFSDFEIIAINDGSTDNTLDLLEELARIEKRLRIITQENAGVSAARNRGIEEAKGKYIVFCDADDFVGENYIADFVNVSHPKSSLVIQYPTIYDEKNGLLRYPCVNILKGCYNIVDGISKAKLLSNGYPFGKLFDTNIVLGHSLRFRQDISYKEDLIFILEYLQYVDLIDVTEGTDYRYCTHSNSLSTKWKHPDEVIAINSIIEILLDRINVPAYCRSEFEEFCVGETLHLMYNAPSGYSVKISSLAELRNSMRTDAFLMQTKFDRLLKPLYLNRYFLCFDLLKRLSNVLLKIYNR